MNIEIIGYDVYSQCGQHDSIYLVESFKTLEAASVFVQGRNYVFPENMYYIVVDYKVV